MVAESTAAAEEQYDATAWEIEGDVESYNGTFELPPVNEMYEWELVDKEKDVPQLPKYNPTGKKMRSRFHFQLVNDEDWGGFVLKQYINLSLNEKSALRPFVEAMLGRPLEAKEKIAWNDNPATNTTGIGNLRFRAILKEDKKEDGRVFGVLDSPLPLKGSKSKPAARVEAAPAATGDGDAPF